MPWVDDLLDGLNVQIDKLWYDLLRLLAVTGWTLQKGLFMMGHAIELANLWLVENAFSPLIAYTNSQMQATASLAFVIALMVLGITYLLAVFVKLDVVSPRSAVGWYLAGIVFFQLGPTLFQGMHDFRRDLSEGFYNAALDNMQSAGSPFASLSAVQSDDLPPLEACDALGSYLPGATDFGSNVDGLDIALAYLLADGQDVMGYPPPVLTLCQQPRGVDYDPDLPTAWQFFEDGYFYSATTSYFFGDPLNAEERKASIDKAGAAQFRIFSAWPMVIFGVAEQLIFLLLTIAQGLTFVSFSVAILFAYFKKTEVIARSVLDMWIELIVQTIAIALMQSLIVSFLLGAAATQNALVVLGVSLLCAIFTVVLLWSGIKAVWNSFNRLFGAIGQVTGGVMVAPGAVGLGMAGASVAAGVGTAAAAANVGSSAMAGASALRHGATVSQTAGVMLGGSRRLQSAARTLAYLPGTRHTTLGKMADEFTEGAVLRQVGKSVPVVGDIAGPVLGAKLLSDRRQTTKRKRNADLPDDTGHDSSSSESGAVQHAKQGSRGKSASQNNVPPPTNIQPPESAVAPPAVIRPPESVVAPPTVIRPPVTANADSGEEIEERVSDIGASVRSQTGQTRASEDRLQHATDQQGEEIEERIAALGATANAGHPQPTPQIAHVEGTQDVAGVMGSFISQMRVQRTLDGQPLVGGTDQRTVAQGVAQAMGVTPEPGARTPLKGDTSGLNTFANYALRLGLTGQQAQTVISEVKHSPAGQLTPQTHAALVSHAHSTLNTGWEGAERAVNALQQAAAMLPNAITARGSTTNPNVQVQVNAASTSPNDLDDTMKSHAALAGNQAASIQGGEA